MARIDEYEVKLDGDLTSGRASDLTLAVTKDGKPVRNPQPYLGAYGHIVALRSGDLAYLHAHPNGEPLDGNTESGPEVSFTATAPSAGAYRQFLDFRPEGKVRSAAFTVHAGGVVAESEQPSQAESAEERRGTHTEACSPHPVPVRAAPECGGRIRSPEHSPQQTSHSSDKLTPCFGTGGRSLPESR